MQIKNIAFFRAAAVSIAVIGLTAQFLLTGCGGGNNTLPLPGTNPANPFDLGRAAYVGRVLYRFQYVLTDAQSAVLTQGDKDALAKDGATIGGNTITLPDVPAAGHWIKIGATQTNTDSQGRFGFAAMPKDASEGGIYIQLSDIAPRATFPVSKYLVAAGGRVPDFVIVQSTPLPGEMNPGAPGKAVGGTKSAGPCCTKTGGTGTRAAEGRLFGQCVERNTANCAGNTGPCCLDFNNPSGNGKAYIRAVLCPTSFTNFLHSTCYDWSQGGSKYGYTIDDAKKGNACANEAAFLGGQAPGCFLNHKYRNCQNLDNSDFSVKAEKQRVFAGETMQITIRNNTQANETDVQMTANPGSLTGDGFAGTMLKHYDDSATTHYEERKLTYQAPVEANFPAGKDEFNVTVDGTGFDKKGSVTFVVCKCAPAATKSVRR